MSIFIQSSNDNEGFFGISQVLRIHTGLRKWNKKDRFHMLLCDNNTMGINRPCIKIANNEVLFEKYRMALKLDKDAIDIQGDDTIKRKQIFFRFHAKNVQSSKSIICEVKKSSYRYNLKI